MPKQGRNRARMRSPGQVNAAHPPKGEPGEQDTPSDMAGHRPCIISILSNALARNALIGRDTAFLVRIMVIMDTRTLAMVSRSRRPG